MLILVDWLLIVLELMAAWTLCLLAIWLLYKLASAACIGVLGLTRRVSWIRR